jgi:hypothetical protein
MGKVLVRSGVVRGFGVPVIVTTSLRTLRKAT